MLISELIQHLETIAPKGFQENYDNSGLLIGNASQKLKSALLTLDVTEQVVDEALKKKSNLIIAHHPLIFSSLKSITGKNEIEKCIIKAIKNGICIYACHTNLDNIQKGVNKKLSEKIGLIKLKILSPKENTLLKLTTYVPVKNTKKVMDALHKSGAGNIGNYSDCSFQITGTGFFKPNENANPHIGSKNKLESVEENRVEVILPSHLKNQIIKALKDAHPYEEVAYYLHELKNENQEVGSGMIGELAQSMSTNQFLKHLKKSLKLEVIKYTPFQKNIKKVAVCGGSGKFLLQKAIANNADAFVSADFKYHDFFEAENRILIADVGHYESEQFTKELFYEIISEKFSNIALVFSETYTNPIRYYK